MGFTDPEHGIGFGYVMNKMMAGLNGDPRSGGLIKALYAAIGVEPDLRLRRRGSGGSPPAAMIAAGGEPPAG